MSLFDSQGYPINFYPSKNVCFTHKQLLKSEEEENLMISAAKTFVGNPQLKIINFFIKKWEFLHPFSEGLHGTNENRTCHFVNEEFL